MSTQTHCAKITYFVQKSTFGVHFGHDKPLIRVTYISTDQGRLNLKVWVKIYFLDQNQTFNIVCQDRDEECLPQTCLDESEESLEFLFSLKNVQSWRHNQWHQYFTYSQTFFASSESLFMFFQKKGNGRESMMHDTTLIS